MPLEISWQDIAIRLLCTVFAGAIIGFNREEHGRTAGLRTTILLCLSASLAMILANLMLNMNGKMPGSFIQNDLMRLPLGILTGVGFIGAGAILRKDNLVLGVTTAATLWFITTLGLIFGSGHIILGFVATGIGFITLAGLKSLEKKLKLERHATLVIVTGKIAVTEKEIAQPFLDAGYKINFTSIAYDENSAARELHCEARWRGPAGDSRPPEFIKQMLARFKFEKMEWRILGET
jgi:putative Mg2+ transporter-C (MgtC) family protein